MPRLVWGNCTSKQAKCAQRKRYGYSARNCIEIVALQEHHNLRLVQHPPEALHDFVLTICATNAEGVSEQAYSIAINRGQWINCNDAQTYVM